MSKRIVLVKNPGNSGGAWLMRVWSMHEEILMFAEAAQALRLRYVPKKIYPKIEIDFDKSVGQNTLNYNFEVSTRYDIARGFLLDQFLKRKENVIGLIKCFDEKTINKSKEVCKSVKVVQTLRNPIGIIDFYTGYKKVLLTRTDKNILEKEIFKDIVKVFFKSFTSVIKYMDSIPIIRLEDLNISLKNQTVYFKDTMEDLFEEEWSEELIKRVIQEEGYGDTGDINKDIWKNWSDWKKEKFIEYFDSIMKSLNYTIGE